MSKKIIRPGLTAATAAVRALLAAGWRPDYAHKVGDDITVLSMLRGERRIAASVGDDDHVVDLELTGLTLGQAAAIAAVLAAPEPVLQVDADYVEAVQVALADAGVTVYYSGVGKSFADLWLTPPGATPPGECDGVILKWLPTGWQLVQLVDGDETEGKTLDLSPTAPPADVARVVAGRMAIDKPATQEPDDYWSRLAGRLHEVADQIATLAGRSVMPAGYASLTIGVGGLPHLEAQAVPALAAIAAALGTTVTETEPKGQPPAWYHAAQAIRGVLDVQALCRVTGSDTAGGAQ